MKIDIEKLNGCKALAYEYSLCEYYKNSTNRLIEGKLIIGKSGYPKFYINNSKINFYKPEYLVKDNSIEGYTHYIEFISNDLTNMIILDYPKINTVSIEEIKELLNIPNDEILIIKGNLMKVNVDTDTIRSEKILTNNWF